MILRSERGVIERFFTINTLFYGTVNSPKLISFDSIVTLGLSSSIKWNSSSNWVTGLDEGNLASKVSEEETGLITCQVDLRGKFVIWSTPEIDKYVKSFSIPLIPYGAVFKRLGKFIMSLVLLKSSSFSSSGFEKTFSLASVGTIILCSLLITRYQSCWSKFILLTTFERVKRDSIGL